MASEGKQRSPLVPVAAFALLALGLVAAFVVATALKHLIGFDIIP